MPKHQRETGDRMIGWGNKFWVTAIGRGSLEPAADG
jgi:hypothetical protein